jgi:hypothetical protein
MIKLQHHLNKKDSAELGFHKSSKALFCQAWLLADDCWQWHISLLFLEEGKSMRENLRFILPLISVSSRGLKRAA